MPERKRPKHLGQRPRPASRTALATLLSLGLLSAAQADVAELDPNLRLTAALARFSSYPDVGGVGGASAGSPFPTSINPASLDWLNTAPHRHSVSLQRSNIRFSAGEALAVTGLSLSLGSADAGVLQPTFVHIGHNDAQPGDFIQLGGQVWQLQWGRRLADSLAIGLRVGRTRLDTHFGYGGMPVADARSTNTSVGLGTLWQPAPGWLLGLVAEQARAPSTTTSFDGSRDDVTTQRSLRPGLSWEYAKDSRLYLEQQWLRIAGPAPALALSRTSLGIEQRLGAGVFLRAGLLRDARLGNTRSLGLGVYPTDRVAVDLSYQAELFPELRPELGRARLLAAAVSLSF